MRLNTTADSPPHPPAEPDPLDCCGEGCAHCIFDLHDAALEKYRAVLAAWQARQPGPIGEAEAGSVPGAPDSTTDDRPG